MREIPLSRGQVAIVDDCDWPALSAFKWHAHKNRDGSFYARRDVRDNGRRLRIYMHRQITGAALGALTDHIDGCGLHNYRTNLRVCNHRQNVVNAKKRKDGDTSQYRGVSLSGRDGNWIAQISACRRHYYLGAFDTPEAAAHAYDAAAREHFGEFARLNFPEATP